MASLTPLSLMDASRDSRIHDWIAEQYSFALSEFDDNLAWRDDPPSLRESKLLPDDFDPSLRQSVTRQPSPLSDRPPHYYDAPLLSDKHAVDGQSHELVHVQDQSDQEDALDALLREMNTWRVPPADMSASSFANSDRNKALPATPSPPSTPTLEDFPSPPPTTPSSPSSSTFPLTPTSSFRPSHRRSKPLQSFSSAADSDSEPVLTTSASYASLRSRTNRYPSISTTLSTAESSFNSSVRHAIYVSAPQKTPPSSPTTPTPTERLPPLHGASAIPSADPVPFAASTDGLLRVYPSGLAAGEQSRWSVASSSTPSPPSRRSSTPTPNSMPALPTFIRSPPKQKRELPSIRTRLLSTLGLRPRSSAPTSPDTEVPYPSASRRNSHRSSWNSATTRRRRADSAIHLSSTKGEKRLVVSGLENGNLDAELAVKRWCESFGELRRISRKDGALHVSWKKASVADTVCRLEARVFINGVGSVALSSVTEPRLF